MKKELIKVVSLMCEINDLGGARVTMETFRNMDEIDVYVYPDGKNTTASIRLSTTDMSIHSLIARLQSFKYDLTENAA